MYSTEQLLLFMIIVSSVLYVSYSCYLIYKMKKIEREIDESQERRVATFMLFIIFFMLSMVYQQHEHSCVFIALWFMYALWVLVKETRKTILPSDKKCFLC